MTVFVDELKVWPHARHECFKRGSAHLTADTLDELHAFAKRLGLRRVWFQNTSTKHYDLSPNKHELALRLGAVFVPAREQAIKRLRARGALSEDKPSPYDKLVPIHEADIERIGL